MSLEESPSLSLLSPACQSNQPMSINHLHRSSTDEGYDNHIGEPLERDRMSSISRRFSTGLDGVGVKPKDEFDSLQYQQDQSRIYRQHRAFAKTGEQSLFGSKWVIFCSVGIMIGLLTFAVKDTIDILTTWKFDQIAHRLDRETLGWQNFWSSWLLYCTSGVVLAFLASVCDVLCPFQGGSGIPPVMGYLNGINLPDMFKTSVQLLKLISVICAVSSGLPVGMQGPLVFLGAALGAIFGEGRSKGWETPFFKKFRNPEDRRDFTTCGAAAGVAAAFGAPIGGLLFAMEQVSSWWAQRLTLMVFCACAIASFTDNLFLGYYKNWEPNLDRQYPFGWFGPTDTIFLPIDTSAPSYILILVPTALLGFLGGALGALFTTMNIRFALFRRAHISQSKCLRILGPVVLCFLFLSIGFWLPLVFDCLPFPEVNDDDGSGASFDVNFVPDYNCAQGTYNPLATLRFHDRML